MSVRARAFSCRLASAAAAALIVSFSLATALWLSSCTPAAKPLGSTPLHWIALETGVKEVGVFERAAIMVDVRVDGQTVWLQLDTGASSIILSPEALDSLGIAYEKGTPVESTSHPGAITGKVGTISMAGVSFRNPTVMLWDWPDDAPQQNLAREPEDPKPRTGTLGAGFFSGRVLELDFRQSALTVLERMPDEAATASVPFASAGTRPVIFANVGGTPVKAMYDTGSSAFPVLLKPSLYLELTGLGSLDESSFRVTANSWGKPVTFYGSPYEGTVNIGGTLLSPGRIWAGELMDGLSADTGCDVIFGNELFTGKCLFIDFGKKRFAIPGGS